MPDTNQPPCEVSTTEIGSTASITFRTDITRDELMPLFAELLNRGLSALGSGLLSLRQDIEVTTFVDLCTNGDESAHPVVVIAATGARAAELKKFYEERKNEAGEHAPLPINHRKIYLEFPEQTEDPKILVP